MHKVKLSYCFVKIIDFLTKGIWHLQINALPARRALGIRLLRVIMLTSQGFTKNQIQHGASALTYYSLLAVVPIIALLIGVARGFLFEHTLESWLLQYFKDQAFVVNKIIGYANASLEKTKGGTIAIFGIAIFVWAGINILTNIELVMNEIWEVKRSRSLAKRFTDYFALLFITPIMVFVATALTGYLSTLFSVLLKGRIIEHLSIILLPLLSIFSFLLISLLFTFLYIIMPNTRVHFFPALIAGLFTGLLYQLLQWLYFYFQIGVANYNAIYGTFAAVPLFLVWLHLSWIVTLMGAKIAFAIQNVDGYEFVTEDSEISHESRLICALRIAHLCIKRFMQAKTPLSSQEISKELIIPHRLTDELMEQLVKAGLLTAIKGDSWQITYQPARNIDDLTIKKVSDMLNRTGTQIPLPDSDSMTAILKNLKQFDHILIKEI